MNHFAAIRSLALVAAVMILATPDVGTAGNPPRGVPAAKLALPQPQPRELRVLFLGNSLTSTHELPGLVQRIAATSGVKVHAVSVAPGGFSLEDHWNDGRGRRLLAAGRWDFLVLQQGPSSLPESQVNLRLWAKRWADEARHHGTTPALYMVWPFQHQKDGFELVSQSYRLAAQASGSRIFPAGEFWWDIQRRDPKVSLYQSDGLHPTLVGSITAAMVITHGLIAMQPHAGQALDKLPPQLQAALRQAWARQLKLQADVQKRAR